MWTAVDAAGRVRTLDLMERTGETSIRRGAKQLAMASIADEMLSTKSGTAAVRAVLDARADEFWMLFSELPRSLTGHLVSPRPIAVRDVVDSIQYLAKNGDAEGVILFDHLGLDPATATSEQLLSRLASQKVLDTWAESSSGLRLSVLQQQAAAAEHGVPLGDRISKKLSSYNPTDQDAVFSNLNRAVVRAEYAVTQRFLKETLGSDATTVRLYRGVQGQHEDASNGDVVSTQMNPLSSWAWETYTAQDFADMAGRNGVVLAMDVPISMIQSTPYTGRGCLPENEVVLIGRPSEATVAMWD